MKSADEIDRGSPDFHLVCTDLNEALGHYTLQLGFRLDSIYPADQPRVAKLSGYGISVCLRLEPGPPCAPLPCPTQFFLQRSDSQAWGEGRAGMQYRDLVPGRFDGRCIASHIRIPNGGPVADYVHHHHVQFQMIYCYKGWVRVVYEDQGEPLVMLPGDCVLQPPHIRHRVLECSDGMEVIEFACPAEHETLLDHDLDLPTLTIDRERRFGGQKFIFHQYREAVWTAEPVSGFEQRDTGIAQATNQIADSRILRSVGSEATPVLCHDAESFFNFVLKGSARLQCSAAESEPLNRTDCFVIPAGDPYALSGVSPDFELLQVKLPGQAKVLVL